MLERLLAALDRILSLVTGAILVVTAVLIFIAVVLRYLFGTALLYSYDLSTLLFGWMVFLGLALAQLDRAHLGLDLVEGLHSRGLRVGLGTLRQLGLAALSFWLAWVGYELSFRTGMRIPSMRISVAWLYSALPIGFALLALLHLVQIRALLAAPAPEPRAR